MDLSMYPDWDNAESLGTNVILACALSPPFALLFVALRFHTARTILRTVRLDDWLILIALILTIGYSVSLIMLTKYGLGHHIMYLFHTGYDFRTFQLIAAFPINITNHLSTLFIKSSILCFYLRFSTSRLFNIVIYVVLFIVVVANFIGALGILFFCRPISFFWDFAPMDGTCIPADPWYAWLIILNCVTDGILLVLPAWIIYPLRVGFAQKAAIAAILGTGGFILGVSIFRVVIVAQGWGTMDVTYRYSVNYIWSVIETNVAIVCACAPCLRALVGRYIPALLNLSGRRETMGLSTIPISRSERIPESPVPSGVKASDTSTRVTASWASNQLGSDNPASSSSGDQAV